ncbi:MAG: YaiO family outer membrane beta-barrel protein [Burkholderiales bacterium]
MKLLTGVALCAAALTLSSGVAAQESGYKVEAEARSSLEQLTGGQSDWRDTALDIQAKNAARQSYYGDLRQTERYDFTDNEAMLGTYQPLGGSWAMQIEAALSPTHHVLAEHSLLAQLERRFDGGWGVQAGYRRSEYDLTGTDLAIITVDRYFSSFRAAYTLYLGRPDGAGFGPSHRLQLSYYYTDRSFIGISGASGKEVDNVPPNGILTTQVRNLSLAGRHEFAPGWYVSYQWLTQHQGYLYTRRGFGFGIRHAF